MTAFLSLLETHIDLDEIIPISFSNHFYSSTGRARKYPLKAMLWALIIQRIFTIPTDQLLLTFLAYSKPLREFCGFTKVPDASKITRFKQDFLDDLQLVFDKLVDVTEPICQEIDSTKADMSIFDSSGIEDYVIENNPKYANRVIKQLRAYAKAMGFDKSYDPYIDRVVKRHNFLKLPLVSGVFLAKVSNRQMLQNPNNMISFLEKNDIKSFDELHSFSSGHLAEYNKLAAKFSGYGNQIKTLMAKIEAYDRFKPFLDVFRKCESLKGLVKWKYDKENRVTLEAYPEQLKAFRKVVPKGEKIDPKKWNDEMAALFDKREDMEGLLQKEVGNLVCVEVIDFNKKNEERELSNDVHAKEKSKERERTPSRKSHQAER